MDSCCLQCSYPTRHTHPPPIFSHHMLKSSQFLDLEDCSSSTVCSQVARLSRRECSEGREGERAWETCGSVEVCVFLFIMDSEVLKKPPPQLAQSLLRRIIKQQQVSQGEKVKLQCQVAQVDVFQLEIFGEIYFWKTKVCLEGTSLHTLLVQTVCLGFSGDGRGVFNSVYARSQH